MIATKLLIASLWLAQPGQTDHWFDRVWDAGQTEIYPAALSERFSMSSRARLLAGRPVPDQPAALADLLNPFLHELGVSHTHLYEPRQYGFYMLRSLFVYRQPALPQIDSIGVQLLSLSGRVKAVLEAGPAAQAGVLAGDHIVTVNGGQFKSMLDWQGRAGQRVRLGLERNGQTLSVHVVPRRVGAHQALIDASVASEKSYRCGDQTIGYFHLWSGTHDHFLRALNSAVQRFRQSTDGMILDLRDGYGGAWWPYLDPFYPNRAGYFVARVVSREGVSDAMVAPPQDNPGYYSKPMVILINDGVRSGKESLAYQFKKTGRATLLGQTTAGAFAGGRGIFLEPEDPVLLYLSVFHMTLDGNGIEGLGVAPDIQFDLDGPALVDAALAHLSGSKYCT